jgi:uncharacterized protein
LLKKMKCMSFPSIYCKDTAAKGRGIFAADEIEADVVIEKCPVILVETPQEINLIRCSSLANYAFRWVTEEDVITIALGYGSLYNHSSKNNARYKMNKEDNTIDIIALRAIQPEEEITISYVGSTGKDPKDWFEARGIQYIE